MRIVLPKVPAEDLINGEERADPLCNRPLDSAKLQPISARVAGLRDKHRSKQFTSTFKHRSLCRRWPRSYIDTQTLSSSFFPTHPQRWPPSRRKQDCPFTRTCSSPRSPRHPARPSPVRRSNTTSSPASAETKMEEARRRKTVPLRCL